ncbi:alpha/beta fold hydrolase [Luteibacter aegosomatissinici]|uniref:alpha/beta fold hydrolase n=1 Tax=Luteibacter aegosomatissinici TaxID=2911539 RepID=UPI001FFA15BC|nr:alpha/beta hydrolase [Luteibacter aegosomatissinici]UPG94543.1 alpha/beta hydrolase [Luteibacter aegosomatissinici]
MNLKTLILGAATAVAVAGTAVGAPAASIATPAVTFHYVKVDDVTVFYREAGDPHKPTVLLLHGFPTSSFMYRNLIPKLADRYHVIAPDLPGFGFTQSPDRAHYAYTFEHLAQTVDHFTQIAGLKTYAIQVFDYGAPVGWRLAVAHPERITAIVSQNGNAYEEGLSTGWQPIQKYWKDGSQANRDALRDFLKLDAIKWQYTHGTRNPDDVAPETYTLDAAMVSRPENTEIQLDLFHDYASNVAMYPKFHEYLRAHKPPVLAVWGKNDPFFLPAGAEAFKRDVPTAEVKFYDTGHFALETNGDEIGDEIHRFLDANLRP